MVLSSPPVTYGDIGNKICITSRPDSGKTSNFVHSSVSTLISFTVVFMLQLFFEGFPLKIPLGETRLWTMQGLEPYVKLLAFCFYYSTCFVDIDESEDMEVSMDKYDTHITAVLSEIVKEKKITFQPEFPSLKFAANPIAPAYPARKHQSKKS